jgi:AcrR family transcriptional regulator
MAVGRPRLLTRDDVAHAALGLVDREGLEALTMQRLGQELGVGTMTVYGYVRSKHELLDLVVDAATGAPEPLSGDGDWRDQLSELMRRAYDLLNDHPAVVQIRLRQPVLRPDSLRFGEAVLRILDGAGVPRAESAPVFRLLFTYLFGYVALSPTARAEDARQAAAAAFAALSPDRYPHLTADADAVSRAMAGDDAFHAGLEVIIDGIATRVG